MTTPSAPERDTDLDGLFEEAVTATNTAYAQNSEDLLHALDAIRDQYKANAPTWNFSQGNLIAENRSLRKRLHLSILGNIVVPVAAILGIALVVFWAYRDGGTRYVPFPVDRHSGKVAGSPIVSISASGPVSIPPAPIGEQIDRVAQVVQDIASADIHHETDVRRWDDAQLFLSSGALKDIENYRSQDHGAFDPFVIGSTGRYCDVKITRIQPTVGISGNLIDVDWTETYSDQHDHVIGTVARTAEFAVSSSPSFAKFGNPYGVVITSFHPGIVGAQP